MKNHGGWQQRDQIGQQNGPIPHHHTVESQSATPDVNRARIPREMERVSPLRWVLPLAGITHRGKRSGEQPTSSAVMGERDLGVHNRIRRPVNGCTKPRAWHAVASCPQTATVTGPQGLDDRSPRDGHAVDATVLWGRIHSRVSSPRRRTRQRVTDGRPSGEPVTRGSRSSRARRLAILPLP